jgi:hypothetical protein
MTGEEIRRNLAEFASRWDTYLGTERAEAQPFLEDLSAASARRVETKGSASRTSPAAGFSTSTGRASASSR